MLDRTNTVICFYSGKECGYGKDAPIEDQMDCMTCPEYLDKLVWKREETVETSDYTK